MSKVAFLALFPQIFLTTFLFFLETPKFFRYPKTSYPPPQKFSASPNFFTLLDLKILFLDFIDLENVFSPKKPLF